MPLHRKLVVQALTGILVVLVPLAYARLPDPTWVAGIYDNADYDDAVLAVTSAEGALDSAGATVLTAPRSSVRLSAAPETAHGAFGYILKASRAPPVE